jgi:hypothetical protein
VDSACYVHELINDQAKLQTIQEDDSVRAAKLNDLINFVNTDLNEIVKNFSPFDSEELDERIT